MGVSGMTFNGIRKPYFIMLDGREKVLFSPLLRNVKKYSGGHKLKKTENDLFVIHQPYMYVVNDDYHAMNIRDDFVSWLITEEIAQLQFDDEPGRTYWVVVQNSIPELNELEVVRTGTIEFLCFYTTRQEKEINLTSSFQTHTITGQKETPWKTYTRFTVPQSQFRLENSDGLMVLLNYNFVAGDVLEIDYFGREVKLNGNDLAVAVSISTNWMMLKPGQVQLKSSQPTILRYKERLY